MTERLQNHIFQETIFLSFGSFLFSSNLSALMSAHVLPTVISQLVLIMSHIYALFATIKISITETNIEQY